jgi:hypothetical protein
MWPTRVPLVRTWRTSNNYSVAQAAPRRSASPRRPGLPGRTPGWPGRGTLSRRVFLPFDCVHGMSLAVGSAGKAGPPDLPLSYALAASPAVCHASVKKIRSGIGARERTDFTADRNICRSEDIEKWNRKVFAEIFFY